MNPLGMIKLVPYWVYLLVIAMLLTWGGVQTTRVAVAQKDLAVEVQERAVETTERTQLALANQVKVSKIKSEHAASQQLKDENYAKQINQLRADNAVYTADSQRLRNKVSAFASGAVRAGETNAAACQRAVDRLPAIGALLGQSVELEAESRAVIKQRDAEVKMLLDQIRIDRKACGS